MSMIREFDALSYFVQHCDLINASFGFKIISVNYPAKQALLQMPLTKFKVLAGNHAVEVGETDKYRVYSFRHNGWDYSLAIAKDGEQ